MGRVAAQDTSGKMRAFYLQVGAESLQSFDKLPPLPGGTRTDYQSESYGVNSLGERSRLSPKEVSSSKGDAQN